MYFKPAQAAEAGAYELTETQLDHVAAAGDAHRGSGEGTGADSSGDEARSDGLRHEVGHNISIGYLDTGS